MGASTATSLSPRPGAAPGKVLAGRYRLERFRAVGGMGEVWSADQLALGRPVAVKFLTEDAAGKPEAVARFEMEARSLSRVDDEHVVRIHDFGHDGELGFFLVTDLLEGRLLSELVEDEQRLEPVRAARILAQVLEGLLAAHKVGIVHRDLKPENVMLVERGERTDVVKLLDFGIAKVIDEVRRKDLTEFGTAVGTPAYLAPEQAMGRPVDYRTDIYACGVLLFRILSGRLPFTGSSVAELAVKHATEAPPPLPEDAGPPQLAEVVRRALEKDPDDRFPDAPTMRSALLQAVGLLANGEECPAPSLPQPAPVPGGDVTASVAPPGFVQGTMRPASVPVTALLVKLSGGDGVRSLVVATAGAEQVVRAYRGRISRFTADGLLVLLPSLEEALTCAAAVVDRMQEEPGSPAFDVQVRVAVAATESGGAGLSLSGDAVARLETIASAAAPGEVLFSDGLEPVAPLRAEAHQAEDPATRFKLRKLIPPLVAVRPELPFGGAGLHRLEELWSRKLSRAAERGANAAGSQLRLGSEKAELAGRTLLVHVLARPGLAAGALAAGLAVLGLGSWLVLPVGPAVRIERALAAGDVVGAREQAQAFADELPRDGARQLLLARALVEEGELPKALLALRSAHQASPELGADPAFGATLTRCFSGQEAGAAQALALLVGPPLEPALLATARAQAPVNRWVAVRTLEELGLGDHVDRVELWGQEVRSGADCDARVKATRKLVELGGQGAPAALVDARLLLQADPSSIRGCTELPQAIDAALAKLRKAEPAAREPTADASR